MALYPSNHRKYAKRSLIKWIKLYKTTYRDHLNQLMVITKNDIKFNILENIDVIKLFGIKKLKKIIFLCLCF